MLFSGFGDQTIVVGHQLCVAANICCLEGGEFDLESLTAHGCKASLLSMMSKYGMSEHDRAILGYHMRKNQRTSIAVYSRDQQSAPLRRMEKMLDIRRGNFLPDAFRSGMVVDPDRRDLESKDDGPMVLLVVQNIENLMLKVDMTQNWDLLYFMMGRWPKHDLN